MSDDTVPVVFTQDELWLMRACVRHEQSPPWQGRWPCYSLELNEDIAEALVFCEDEQPQPRERALLLSRGDCLLLDAVIPQDAKSPGGVPLGKNILMKTFRARRAMDGAIVPTAVEALTLSEDEIHARMQEFAELPPVKQVRRMRRKAT